MFELDASVSALTGRPLGADEPFGVAVSGGPDSLALLLLAQVAYGWRVRCLTVDHGLRADSAAEAAAVGAICAGLGVQHTTLLWEGNKPGSNIHAAAREARYRLMGDWCAASGVAWLATAHHADDQAETLLLRMARGSGVGGLAGIRQTRRLPNGVTLLRPLLGQRRSDLRAVVEAAGLTAFDDPSNADPRYDRTQARGLLADTPWLEAERLAASAGHLAEAEAALAWTADIAWRGRANLTDGEIELDAAGLPAELVRRVLVRALATLGCEQPRGPDVERMIGRLTAGQSATLGGVKAKPGPLWRLELTSPRAPSSAGS